MQAFNIEDQAAILARSTQLTEQHRNYLAKHPALTQLMHDLLTNVLVNKPDDCYQFCQEYFAGFLGGDGTGDTQDGWGYAKCRTLLIVGPSGAGKRLLAQKLVSMHDDKFMPVISHTTRAPRAGEKDQVDYIFTDREAIEIGKEGGDFLSTVEVEGEIYGTTSGRLNEIIALGRVPIITCSLAGALVLRKELAGEYMPRCVLLKPSKEELSKRLKTLGLSDEVVEAREKACTDFENTLKNHPGLFDMEQPAQFVDGSGLLSETVVSKVAEWALKENWEVEVDQTQAKAALKIQGQARRRRDSRKVRMMKGQAGGRGGRGGGAGEEEEAKAKAALRIQSRQRGVRDRAKVKEAKAKGSLPGQKRTSESGASESGGAAAPSPEADTGQVSAEAVAEAGAAETVETVVAEAGGDAA